MLNPISYIPLLQIRCVNTYTNRDWFDIKLTYQYGPYDRYGYWTLNKGIELTSFRFEDRRSSTWATTYVGRYASSWSVVRKQYTHIILKFSLNFLCICLWKPTIIMTKTSKKSIMVQSGCKQGIDVRSYQGSNFNRRILNKIMENEVLHYNSTKQNVSIFR